MQGFAMTGATAGFRDAAADGFSPAAGGRENRAALQRAVDRGGTIGVTRPGIYDLAGAVYVGSDTTLIFGAGVFLRKVADPDLFMHVLLNKGALTRTRDRRIGVHGLNLIVNGVDVRRWEVFGLLGQVSFFHIEDLRITGFRCLDLGCAQFALHICAFEDILVDDVIVKGRKDGVHLGRGKRFCIRNGVFDTVDDAIALNGHDYDVGNPELGWIEDGVVENCHDLSEITPSCHFCRILAGAWIDWRPGMEVQKSDTVVSGGKLYRVKADADGRTFISKTRPEHPQGEAVLDGDIHWAKVQDEAVYTAGVRNVTFRDIFLHKPRIGFLIVFDNDRYSRSYYPGAPIPLQEKLFFDGIRTLHDSDQPLIAVSTPVDLLQISRSTFRRNRIVFYGNEAMPDYGRTRVAMNACVFEADGPQELLTNSVAGKEIDLRTIGSVAMDPRFEAQVAPGRGTVRIESDLPGLCSPRPGTP